MDAAGIGGYGETAQSVSNPYVRSFYAGVVIDGGVAGGLGGGTTWAWDEK